MIQAFKHELTHNGDKFWLREISVREKKFFNLFLEKAELGNVFQTYQWGETKSVYGWHPIRLILEDKDSILGAVTILERTAGGMTFFYSPRGPVIDYNKPYLLSLFCQGITHFAKSKKAIFWRIDPELPSSSARSVFEKNKFQAVSANNPFGGIQPKWVWRIPLKKTPEEQWKLIKKSGRRPINKARKAGVEIRPGGKKDISVFYQLLAATAQRNGFLMRDIKYYKNLWAKMSSLPHCKMLIAYHNEEPVSTALAIGFGQGVWDIYAGNSDKNRDIGASYLLTWELLVWALENGYAFYDLGGISPSNDENHPLAGLKMFKSRFGGSEVEFIGEYDLVFRPLAYRLWNIGVKSFQTITRFKKLIKR